MYLFLWWKTVIALSLFRSLAFIVSFCLSATVQMTNKWVN